jgi:ParB family chromosome partitioning protein
MVVSKQLSAGHARALLKFDDREMQRDIAQRCASEGWSVRQIESYTRPKAAVPKAERVEKPVDPNVKFAMSELERVLGTRVKIVETGKGKGRIEIEYYNEDDLNRIYELVVNE